MTTQNNTALQRTLRLFTAVVAASDRLVEHNAPLHFDVIVPKTVIGRQGSRTTATLDLIPHQYDAWRLTSSPDVKYAEIKLVPELKSLILPQPSGVWEYQHVFLQVDVATLAQSHYTAVEINQIIRLLDRLQPLGNP